MKKVAAVFVSIGVILVIAGLVMVGIFGGEAIRNTNWKDVFSGTTHNLDSANKNVDYGADELDGLFAVSVRTDRFSVYVLPSENDVLSVKYVDPIEEGAAIDVKFSSGVLNVTETDNLKSGFWNGLFNRNRFVAVYVPQTEAFANLDLYVTTDVGGVAVKNVGFVDFRAEVHTGGVYVSNCKMDKLIVEGGTGSVTLDNISCFGITVNVGTGSVNVDDVIASDGIDISANTGSVNLSAAAKAIGINTNTGSVNFDVTSDNIAIKTDTGSVNGDIKGSKAEYQISVRKDTGKSNIKNQSVANATKFLTVEVDTGSINIDFDN